MNFNTINRFAWIFYDGQRDNDVTYIFVASTPIPRLAGASDILYIGKTEQPISKRFKQETSTKNSPKNTQQTNIRMTHIFSKIGLSGCKLFYIPELYFKLYGREIDEFIEKLKIWDKQFYLKHLKGQEGATIIVPAEKYLLANYADEHLEVPPLNNRM